MWPVNQGLTFLRCKFKPTHQLVQSHHLWQWCHSLTLKINTTQISVSFLLQVCSPLKRCWWVGFRRPQGFARAHWLELLPSRDWLRTKNKTKHNNTSRECCASSTYIIHEGVKTKICSWHPIKGQYTLYCIYWQGRYASFIRKSGGAGKCGGKSWNSFHLTGFKEIFKWLCRCGILHTGVQMEIIRYGYMTIFY